MRPRGVNRVTVIVRDLEQGEAFYSKLLGATFCSVNDAEAERFGIRCVAALDRFAQRYCPIIKRLERRYHWSLMQVEYATDIVFHYARARAGLKLKTLVLISALTPQSAAA